MRVCFASEKNTGSAGIQITDSPLQIHLKHQFTGAFFSLDVCLGHRLHGFTQINILNLPGFEDVDLLVLLSV